MKATPARAFELLAASKHADTPVGVVKSAGRKKEEKWLTTLGAMDFEPVDMTSPGDRREPRHLCAKRTDDHPARLQPVTAGDVLVIGGTSDARQICQQLDAAGVGYTLSVATPTGQQLAGNIRGQVRCGRLELGEMVALVTAKSHPLGD